MSEGIGATFRAAAGLPHRHPFAIAGVCTAIVAIILGAGIYNAQERISVVHKETTRLVQAANVCGARSLESTALSRECADRLRNALLNCRRYSSCRAALLAATAAPVTPEQPVGVRGKHLNAAAPPPEIVEGGGAQSPGHNPPGQPGGGGGPRHHHAHHVESPPPPETGPPAPAPEGEAPAQPGHSGKGASAEHGVDACVEVVVSACVKAEVGE